MQRFVIFLLFIVVVASCRKKNLGLETSGVLTFSTAEVTFDTVFTGVGSATKFFKVYNPHDKDIEISRVFIEGGSSSQFRFNFDGVPGNQTNVVIAARDSAFVFVEVTVNTGFKDNPFIIEDNINFVTNGQTQKVKTTAWGQDAYYYFPNTSVQGLPSFSRITDYNYQPAIGDEYTWKNDKPHVIYGYLRVDSTITLKIEKGTQIHFHEGAGLWIANGGSLVTEGAKEEEVVFQGDRLEEAFQERPGQWDRIWINEGGTSSLRHTIIKNGYVGLQAETTPFDPNASMSNNKLTLQKVTIRNMVGVGILTRNFKMDAENVLIYEVGNQDLAINGGGEYNFKHCTFANYWSGSNRQQPLFFVNNYYQDFFGDVQNKDLEVKFDNCIFYGNKTEEIELDSTKDARFEVTFNHCLLKTELDTATNPNRYIKCLVNPQNGFNSPVFTNPGMDEYLLYSGSTAQDKGDPLVPSTMVEADDLKEEMRDSEPDIGCYEYIK